MDKTTAALSAANWRRPKFLHDQHIHQIKMPRKRKSSTSSIDFDMTNPATHWRRSVTGADPLQIATDPIFGDNKHTLEDLDGKSVVMTRCAMDHTPLVLEVFIHECNDPRCKEHNGLFNNAEIRSIRNATRFRSQTRDGEIAEFGKHLKGVKVTPRKSSMMDLTMPCKLGKSGIFNGNGHSEEPREQAKRNEAGVIYDPAVTGMVDRGLKPAGEDSISGQADRFQGLLRKLQRSSHNGQSSSMAKKPGENRPRQGSGDSGDSSVDVRSSVKTRSLNPMAKEFSVFAPKQDPIVEKSEETSINIPLSMLRKILGSSDPSNFIEAPQQKLEEIVANTIQRFGIPEAHQQHIAPPTAFSPLVITVYFTMYQPNFRIQERLDDASGWHVSTYAGCTTESVCCGL
ncbi:uncharacterized protein ColSpa_10490 [Colletotrichum spaethianum]|uniref:Uncharacterized protein n=1 Tax=Colletotrichum spaethianum TaxID=700344 RepID=A0AA37UJU2_9PEZI|nr:uncharacterized protein ColSpa_10490 [Colletotrichum spaethianum]GKT50309.1 hypothetical protein ColSpa_10490 [Colletotrichum spaethianum]